MPLILRHTVILMALSSVGCFSTHSPPIVEPSAEPAPNEASATHEEGKEKIEEMATAPTTLIETFYLIKKQDKGFKIYAEGLAEKQTVIAGNQTHLATLQSTGTEALKFETNFIEKSEIESENIITKTMPYGQYQLEGSLGDHWSLATPGAMDISEVVPTPHAIIQPDTSTGLLKALQAKFTANEPSIKTADKVFQFEDSTVIQHADKAMWFVNERLVLEVPSDYTSAEIQPLIRFKSGDSTYYAGEFQVNDRQGLMVFAATGEQWTRFPIVCGHCIE